MRIHLAGQVQGHIESLPRFEEHPEMRVHFAAEPLPNPKAETAFRVGHTYYLVSYWYAKKGIRTREQALGADPRNVIMDSGLFSLMFGSEKGTIPSTLDAYERYTTQYLEDLAAWKFGGYVVEADVHKLLGMDAVHRLRRHFTPLGDRVIYVWHREEGLDGLLKLAEERSYIAISVPEIRSIVSGGGSVTASSDVVQVRVFDLLRRIHAHCKTRGILPPRIHLLGCTVASMMQTRLAWSCDSTSWLAGIQYGRGFIWNPQGRFEGAAIRSDAFLRWRAECEAMFPSSAEYARASQNPEYYLNIMACAAAFREYQGWLDARFQHVPMRGDENGN